MSKGPIHSLIVSNDPSRWEELILAAGIDSVLTPIAPDPELVLQEITIGFYPLVILAPDSCVFDQTFYDQAAHLIPGSSFLIATTTECNYDSIRFSDQISVRCVDINSPIEFWTTTILQAVEQWHERSATHDEAAVVERLSGFYHTLLEGIPQGIAIFNNSCRLIVCNRVFETTIGRSKLELLNHTCADICSSICTDQSSCIVEQTLHFGEQQRLVIQIPNSAGDPRTIEFRTERLLSSDQKPLVLLLSTDVSKRIELESRLSQQNDFLERLLYQAPIGIIVTNSDFIIQMHNNRFSDRIKPEFGIQTGQSLRFHPLNANNRLIEYLEFALSHTETLKPIQIWVEGKKENLYLSLSAGTVHDSMNRPEGLIITIEDVTEEYKLLQEIATKEEDRGRRISELQMLGEVSRALHSAKDLDEVLYLILVAVTSDMGIGFNRAFFLLLDPSTSELTGQLAIGPGSSDEAGKIWSDLGNKKLTLQELFADWRGQIGSNRAVNEMVNRLKISLKVGESQISKVVSEKKAAILRRSDSTDDAIWNVLNCDECAVVPLNSKERAEGVLLVDNAINRNMIVEQQLDQLERFTDIAATAVLHARWYKQLEQRLRDLRSANTELRENRDKLIRSERLIAIGEIAATVAHEIRNPMAAIGGLARLIQSELPPENSLQTYLTTIVDEIHRLERIVNDTLDFVKPWRSKFAMTQLPEIVSKTLKLLAAELDNEQYYIQTYFDPGAEWVVLDIDQIHQVIYNLIKNAIHAMPEGGIIVVTTKRTEIEIELDVRDYGKGISQEVSDRIFDPFFTTKATGSGIGLSVSRQIMKQHGGQLAHIPVEGPGAMFRLTFPIPDKESHHD